MSRYSRLALAGAMAAPWLLIWQGLDFTDQGYLATGYRCFFRHPEVTEDSGHMWLTNLVGAIWDELFGGLGIVSVRALWAVCMSLALLIAFRLARSLTGELAAALATLAASVFLVARRETWFSYNTASSFLFVAMAACLLRGITTRRPVWLLAAGALIGSSPFARFPNLLAGALVAAPLFAGICEANWRGRVRDTVITLAGVGLGVGVLLALIGLRGDAELYFGGVRSLFAPSMQNAGYATDSLLTTLLKDESRALGWGLAVCVVGLGLARVLALLPASVGWALLVIPAALGVFGLTNSEEPWRWVVPGTLYLLLGAVALGLWKLSVAQRAAAFVMLIIVLIAPLGSNNGLKNAHMSLWLALPFVIALLATLRAGALWGQGPKLALLAGVVLVGEGLHWSANYTYRDATRDKLVSRIAHPQLRAQYTTPARAKVVTEVLAALEQRVAPGDYLLAYEGTPLLQYLTKTRPYLNRPWLMGWENGAVVAQLAAEAPRRTDCLPVVVLTLKTTRTADWPRRARKLESREPQRGVRKALKTFLRSHGYESKWQNGFFEILEPPALVRGKCR